MLSPRKPISRAGTILRRALSVLLVLVPALLLVLCVLWCSELATLSGIRMLRDRNDGHSDGAVYSMHVHGGFYLDEFVEQGGVSSDGELLSFVTGHLTKGLSGLRIRPPAIGCASFTAWNTDQDMLFARNYDFSKTNTCIVFTEAQEGRHATISTVDLQFLGLNPQQNPDRLVDRVKMLAAPYVPLDGINDAANTSCHYMVADASGRSAILEWVAGTNITDLDGSVRQLVVTYSDQDAHIGPQEACSDYQVVTNFVLQPGYYAGLPAEYQKGVDRYNHLWEELNSANGQLADEQAAMDLLGSVGRRV